MNYYEILHLSNNFTEQQLKQSYRTLVIKYNPDKNPKEREKFEYVVSAYKTLIDSKKRKDYDLYLKNRMIFLDTYFDLISMCLNKLQQNQKSIELFLTIDNELPFTNSEMDCHMKKLVFQISTCAHYNQILYTVQMLLTSIEIKKHKKGMDMLKKILKYVLSEIKTQKHILN